MKFFIYNVGNNVIDPVTIQQVDGYSLQYSIQNFLIGDGYGGSITEIKQKLTELRGYNKKALLSIMWGSECGNGIWLKYPYIEMVIKAHSGAGSPQYHKFPNPFNTTYMDNVYDFLQWLAIQLEPYLDVIDGLYVNGLNRTTKEIRFAELDYTTTNDTPSAYAIAAHEWLGIGYTNNLVHSNCYALIDYYKELFPNTKKICALVGGKNGFPRIDMDNMVCEVSAEPIIANDIVDYCKTIPNIEIMATALTDVDGTPAYFVNSGLPMNYQLNASIYNKTPTAAQFDGALLNGFNHGGDNTKIELINNNVRSFGDIIQKYR